MNNIPFKLFIFINSHCFKSFEKKKTFTFQGFKNYTSSNGSGRKRNISKMTTTAGEIIVFNCCIKLYSH